MLSFGWFKDWSNYCIIGENFWQIKNQIQVNLMKKLMLLSLFLVSSQVAMAVNWVLLGIGEANGEKIYTDYDSIKSYYFNNKSDNYITVWTKTEYQTDRLSNNNQPYRTKLTLDYLDCKNQKWDFSYVIYHNKNGKVVDYTEKYVDTNSSSGWKIVVPETLGQLRLNWTCFDYNNKYRK